MDKSEIIERLKNVAKHAVHTVGERPFIMSLDDGIAVHEAIELLEKAETVEAIPVDWIKSYLSDCAEWSIADYVIKQMLYKWRKEQEGE